jgi:methyltransferase (TIGR00027 family)
MISGRVSQTALKVGLMMITLNEKPEWRNRLPAGMAEMTERLILAAGVFGYDPNLIRVNKRPWIVGLSDYFESMMPGVFKGIGERKIFINDQVFAAIEAGAEQVLVIGAGFDTLCLRLAPEFPQVHFFEVDHPATSRAKAKGVKLEGQPDNMILLEADLKRHSIAELLDNEQRWDSSACSTIVAEGLFLYLREAEVLNLFEEVAKCTGPGSRFVFSHGVTVETYQFTKAWLRLIGEPWLSSCATEDLATYIGSGWSVIATHRARSKRELEGFAVAEKN